jgi:endonuclease YncB( thermonuclease family)
LSFKVSNVIDGDALELSSNWKWNNLEGRIVRINGYDAPEMGSSAFEEARKKLMGLVINKEVELSNPIRITYGRLLCDVLLNGKNVADFFVKSE